MNVYRFSSKERHANTGMYYYGYRFYDPNLQRWLNRDPIGELGHQAMRAKRSSRIRRDDGNLYLFVHNNPITRIDPDGREVLIYYEENGVPTCKSPLHKDTCTIEIAAVASKFAANFADSGNSTGSGVVDDSLQHCISSCRLTRACGGGFAKFLGQFKEFRDWLMGEGVDPRDLQANDFGRNLAQNKAESCEAACNRTRSQYGRPPDEDE